TYFEFNPAFYNVKENGTYSVQISPIDEKISAEKRLENGYPTNRHKKAWHETLKYQQTNKKGSC
ncbi:MAG: hypothetical protein MUO22_01375, partial [Sedimentisphaerales bacterium]|nr:hypothetical protein [Sedimentisphaerales bacterium]